MLIEEPLSRRKAHTATEADWDFLEDPEVVEACQKAARRAARRFSGAQYDDCLHEAFTYVAVRPAKLKEWQERGHGYLTNRVYDLAIARSLARDARQVPFAEVHE